MDATVTSKIGAAGEDDDVEMEQRWRGRDDEVVVEEEKEKKDVVISRLAGLRPVEQQHLQQEAQRQAEPQREQAPTEEWLPAPFR